MSGDVSEGRSLPSRSRGAPQGPSVEPFRILSHHLVVKFLCTRGPGHELLKIHDVLAG